MAKQPFTHLIAIGACYIDTILMYVNKPCWLPQAVPNYPLEDAKQRASSISRRRGGNCPNTLEVLQQLYHTETTNNTTSTHHPPNLVLLSVLPSKSSQDTQFIQNSYNSNPDQTSIHPIPSIPVNLSHALYRPSSTAASSYIIQSQSTNTRTIVNHNPLSEMTLSEFQDAFTSLRALTSPFRPWIHFEGRVPQMTQQCIDWLHSSSPELVDNLNDIVISVECEKPRRQGLEALADRADLVFFSKSWAEGQGYTGASECVCGEAGRIRGARRAQGVGVSGNGRVRTKVVLCCTWGEDGAAILEAELGHGVDGYDGNRGKQEWEVAVDVDKVVRRPAWVADEGQWRIVDTVGAGDTWIAGMLFAFMSRADWELGRKVEFANEIAGLKITREGFAGLGEQVSNRMA